MKRSIFAFLVFLGAFVISLVTPLVYNRYVNETQSTGDTKERAAISYVTAQVLNPVFENVEDAVQFHRREVEQQETDSLFKTMPPEAVRTIATVLIGRANHADKKSIVNEYKNNYKSTYQYVIVTQRDSPPVNKSPKNSDTIQIPPSEYQDTIINGKHVKLIKEVL